MRKPGEDGIDRLIRKQGHDEDEFDRLRRKWANMLSGGDAGRAEDAGAADADVSRAIETLTDKAQVHWDRMNDSPGASGLWSDLPGDAISAQLTASYRRIKAMAVAFSTPGSRLFGSPDLRESIVQALDWMYEHRYNESSVRYDNWWDWDIGVPLELNDILALLYDGLGPARIARYAGAIERCMPEVSMSGANRVWSAIIVGVRGAIVKDGAKIAAARDGLNEVFRYVTEGDGFYTDGSFVQHRHYAYTGGYGISLLSRVADLTGWLHDSSWAVSDGGRERVAAWVHEAYRPLLYKGAMMDMSRGREISRPFMQDHDAGHAAIQAILRVARFAPAAAAANLRSMAKAWIGEDTHSRFYANASVDLIRAAKAIAHDDAVMPAAPLEGYWQYASMDRAVHRRAGFGFAIAMYSARISSFESINRENLKGWYTGFGATYLYNDDLGQFSGGYWPTVDALRMPGTTVPAGQPIPDHKGAADWVGGTDLDGRYGACGMEVRTDACTLTARKSWFLFDDEIVALGAGISSREGTAVETVVENRKLDDRVGRQPVPDADEARRMADGRHSMRSEYGSARSVGRCHQSLTVDGSARATDGDWQRAHEQACWAHLSGPVPGSDIGYYFPQPVRLNVKCETRCGSWREINDRPETQDAPVSNRYATLWLDHGVDPTDAGYAYVLLPNKTAAEVAAYAAEPGMTVLENSAEAQAVKAGRLGLVAVNFWRDTVKTVDRITCDGQASVIVREADGELALSVSDPTMNNGDTIRIDWAGPVDSVIEADPAVAVLQLRPFLQLAVNVNGARGSARKAKFKINQARSEEDGR